MHVLKYLGSELQKLNPEQEEEDSVLDLALHFPLKAINSVKEPPPHQPFSRCSEPYRCPERVYNLRM